VSTSRLEAFSDGVFAIAITLLVLTIAVPDPHHIAPGGLAKALGHQWPSYVAYVVSFLTIGIIWVNHHATFSHITRVDRPLLFINLLLLMTVSFIPFPTSLVSQYIRDGADARVAALVYACTMTAMAYAFNGLWVWAVHRRLLHGGDEHYVRLRATIPRFGLGVVIYTATIVVALISPPASLVVFGAIAVFYIFDQQSSGTIEPEEAAAGPPT
jgi:uncharacterized membrane protein